jgi:tRNA (mo5U34)-methyltransferase
VVADVGCANGYFMYRMLEHNPKMVVGIDPNLKAWLEFTAMKKFAGSQADKLQFEASVVPVDLM